MKHWSIKLIALILVAVSTATLAVSGLCIAVNASYDLYNTRLETKIEELTQDRMEGYIYDAAMAAAVNYVKETSTDPGTTQRELWEGHYNYTWQNRGIWPEYEYTIRLDGKEVASTKVNTEYAGVYTSTVNVENGVIIDLGSVNKDFPSYDELPVGYKWESYHGKELPDVDSRTVYYELVATFPDNFYRLEWFADSVFQVDIHLTQGDMDALSQSFGMICMMEAAYSYRRCAIPAAAISAVVLLCAVVYLCFAAGKKPGTGEICPRGTNRLPLDLFAAGAVVGAGLFAVLGESVLQSMKHDILVKSVYMKALAFGLCAAGMALIAALLLMALCAQVRLGGGAWFRRTVIGRCWKVIWSWTKKLWNWLAEFCKKLVRCTVGLLRMIPLVWQWLVGYSVLLLLILLGLSADEEIGFILAAALGVPLVLYSAYSFGKLWDAARRISQGDLNSKIDTRQDFLYGCFGDFAGDLNKLGDTCVQAAAERTKSERMKSELITNVSHDIKTPLTSIINYVDLLRQAETEEQRDEYLEVLDRQSQRLKKLIEDLMEMSKASSGNVNVELTQADVVEAVNQALGEFADRMDSMNLNMVFRQSEQSVTANFDGKLLWRVMSNVLSNVVKYALPGTRVYVDVMDGENQVCLSFKNISAQPLNITADELMERFVRGDASRNSEGNGLGLNIARGLMEVQGGTLALTVDGDLFKVILALNKN